LIRLAFIKRFQQKWLPLLRFENATTKKSATDQDTGMNPAHSIIQGLIISG